MNATTPTYSYRDIDAPAGEHEWTEDQRAAFRAGVDATKAEAQNNGRKITSLLETGLYEGQPNAEIYRTHTTGTASGRLHRDIHIGTLYYLEGGPNEFEVYDPNGHRRGFIRHEPNGWYAIEDNDIHLQGAGTYDTVALAITALTGI